MTDGPIKIQVLGGRSGWVPIQQCGLCGKHFKYSHKCTPQRLFGPDSKKAETLCDDSATGYGSHPPSGLTTNK